MFGKTFYFLKEPNVEENYYKRWKMNVKGQPYHCVGKVFGLTMTDIKTLLPQPSVFLPVFGSDAL